jgi:hypothetical protein
MRSRNERSIVPRPKEFWTTSSAEQKTSKQRRLQTSLSILTIGRHLAPSINSVFLTKVVGEDNPHTSHNTTRQMPHLRIITDKFLWI